MYKNYTSTLRYKSNSQKEDHSALIRTILVRYTFIKKKTLFPQKKSVKKYDTYLLSGDDCIIILHLLPPN